MVIADSNIWIHYLRRPREPVGLELQMLIDSERVLMVGVVLAEVLQGARGGREYAALLPRLGSFPYQEMSKETWAKVGEIAVQLRIQGKITPLTDLSIAALALEGGHEVYSLDQHFERIPGLSLYSPRDE
ncbi:MAG: PIN domain-containing protein [Chloroflexi bacterium]|nr:PIN domain-containing protein [Chloroflexota bacterium]